MTADAGDFDVHTTEQTRPVPGVPALLRRCPQLTWTDSRGTHTRRLAHGAVAGSSPQAPVCLADPTVSRLHAELELRDDGVWVRDLGSRNGTWVEGVQVSGARVPEGARILLGAVELRLSFAAAQPVELWPEERFGPLLGRSAAMRELFAELAQCAAVDSTVLVHGETGTGKELVARAIHEASPRAARPLVVVDCAGLPESLLEGELFGHARGAFTGAVGTRAGVFEEAEGGTVFLDEIGELPLSMQPKLLRVIESRTVRRLGEAGHRTVDVRFITATHRDLGQMVNAGAFREDLYFRLAVLPVTVPPLRARAEDIPLLARHFLQGQAALEPQVLEELRARPWLGNVRELKNFVERAIALGPRRALDMMAGRASAPGGEAVGPLAVSVDQPLREAREQLVERFEREYLRQMLERHAGNVPAAARSAGVDKTYIYRLLRRHRL
jgi:transcriptional regulator with GAF, ATPase, and Fis domain